MPTRPEVPAVVVGGTLNALGLVRSLARRSVRVYLIETTRQCAAGCSRYCTFVRSSSLEGEALFETLARLATRLRGRPVLLLTDDVSVRTLAKSRARIEPLYRIELPEEQTVESLGDKLAFQELAQREGFPVPRGMALRGEADLAGLDALVAPIILKPADKRLVLAGLAERAVRADDTSAAREAAARMLTHAPAVIAQEWIEGADSEIYFTLFCAARNGTAAIFPGRKLVCSPPAIGSTALCVAAPELGETLCELTRQFLARVDYRGLGSLEFKRDSRTGELLIVEPTVGRSDWQEEIATLCGLNLPFLAYQLALGEFPSLQYSAPVKSPAWRSDWTVSPPAGFRASTRVIDAYWRWGDPAPGVYYYAYERFARRIGRRIARWTGRMIHPLARPL